MPRNNDPSVKKCVYIFFMFLLCNLLNVVASPTYNLQLCSLFSFYKLLHTVSNKRHVAVNIMYLFLTADLMWEVVVPIGNSANCT